MISLVRHALVLSLTAEQWALVERLQERLAGLPRADQDAATRDALEKITEFALDGYAGAVIDAEERVDHRRRNR